MESRSSSPVHTLPSSSSRDAQGRHDESLQLLDRLRGLFSREVGADRFDRFFGQRARLGVNAGTLDVTVPNKFTRDLLERRFGCDLRRVLRDHAGQEGCELTLRFCVDNEAFGPEPGSPVDAPPVRAQPLAPRPRHHVASSGRRAELVHRLEDFVVGGSNRIAYAAAQRLAEGSDASAVSPLFIHGSCGLGKTHLLQGIANRFRQLNPRARVVYYPAEVFTNEFVAAVQGNAMAAFRKIFRTADLLCIDDVHFVAGKEATQNELLHTLDAIGTGRARIVMASDSHPRSIRKFSEALVSRLVCGAVVRLDPPDLDLRSRIIERLAKRRGLPLAAGASRLIGEQVAGAGESVSVRDIEGMLTQIEAVWKLLPDLATADGSIGAIVVQHALDMRRQGLGRAEAIKQRPVQLDTIIGVVCRELEVELNDLVGQGRHRRVVLARSMAVFLSREMTTRSYPEIASAMARPSHSTIVSAYARISRQIAEGKVVSVGGRHDGLTLRALADRLADEVRRAGGARVRG
ncbi:MAG: AAA family ATPase [Phycisphaerales bacterium]|nr:AAA family ATPase [Phycisphaerales bacterium]